MNEHIKPLIEAAASGPLSHDEALMRSKYYLKAQQHWLKLGAY